MKLFKSIILGVAGALCMTSCDKYLDINNNPNTPSQSTVEISTELPWVQYHLAYAYQAAGYRCQFVCQSMTYTTRTDRNGKLAEWCGSDGVSTTMYQQFFVGSGPSLIDMYNKAMDQEAYHYAGAALVLKSYGFVMLADLFGEMPYKEAIAGSAHPKYDTGDVIYKGCLEELDQAIGLLKKEQKVGAPALSKGDSWANGDVNKWIKMAYLLKARMLNTMSKVEPTHDAEILEALENAQKSVADGVLIAHYDIPETSSDFISGDPMQCSALFDNGGMGDSNKTRATKWLEDILTEYPGTTIEDPRADKILPWTESNMYSDGTKVWRRSVGFEMRKGYTEVGRTNGSPAAISRNADTHSWYISGAAGAPNDTVYVTFRSGSIGYFPNASDGVYYIGVGADKWVYSTSNIFLRPDSPTFWATYSEACFIKAETLMRQGKTGDAKNAYIEGVKASMAEYNKALEVWTDAKYAGCPSFGQMDARAVEQYISQLSEGDVTMEKIMTQKYIATMYSMQNWNDMRRHDYKDYINWATPYDNKTCADNQKIDVEAGKAFRRWNPISHERNYNSDNLKEVCPNFGDASIWYTRVWWDVEK